MGEKERGIVNILWSVTFWRMGRNRESMELKVVFYVHVIIEKYKQWSPINEPSSWPRLKISARDSSALAMVTLSLHLPPLTTLQLYCLPPLPPPVRSSSCLPPRCKPVCQLLYYATVLFKVLYCKTKRFFIFCVCFLCIMCENCHEAITNTVQYIPTVIVGCQG